MKTDGINVLSLFDGMSCGQIALERAGIKVNQYFAAEIDKPAISVCLANYPNTIQVGDVTKVFAKDLPKIDLVIGGSPCQGFSFAGAGLNFNDPRSALFFEFVRLVNECKKANPGVKFLLENVNMKREYLRVISEYLGVYPVNINSNLVSAQNRNRWYWSNIKTKQVGLFSETWTDIPQPKDKGILLKDILQPESEISGKYYLSEKMLNYIVNAKFRQDSVIYNPENKCNCLQAQRNEVVKIDTKGNIKPNQDKASCFTAGAHSGGNHSDMDLICISSNQAHATISINKSTPMVSAMGLGGGHVPMVNTPTIRRLTPIECERLQTVPDNYTACVSDTQRYKMLGNGWTVSVISHIFKQLIK